MPRLRVIKRQTSDAPIDWLVAQFRQFLHLPDPGVLYLVMGTVAANLLEGDPVWLMLVGAPGAGGSEVLNTLLGLHGIVESGLVESTAALLSGSPKKDRAKDATGGLLREIGGHGGIILKDFTSILSLSEDQMRKIMGAFREIYDGRWSRDIGSDGGRKLHWEGKAAFLSKVTGAIDQHHKISATLGERWLYYRIPEGDGFERSKRVLKNSLAAGWRSSLRDAVSAFFAGLDLEFGKLEKHRELTDAEMLRIICMGSVAARCRSGVARDSYSKEVIGARETESETRIVGELGQLFLGMEAIGVGKEDCWRLLGAVTLDSMPALRRMVIEEAKKHPVVGATFEQLLKRMQCSRTTAERCVEDLKIHGVVTREKVDGAVYVHLSDWMKREWRKGWS